VLNLKFKKRRSRSGTVLFSTVKKIDKFSGVLLIEINSPSEEEGTLVKPVKGNRKVFRTVMAFFEECSAYINQRGKL
jgi:hypothetical protein